MSLSFKQIQLLIGQLVATVLALGCLAGIFYVWFKGEDATATNDTIILCVLIFAFLVLALVATAPKLAMVWVQGGAGVLGNLPSILTGKAKVGAVMADHMRKAKEKIDAPPSPPPNP